MHYGAYLSHTIVGGLTVHLIVTLTAVLTTFLPSYSTMTFHSPIHWYSFVVRLHVVLLMIPDEYSLHVLVIYPTFVTIRSLVDLIVGLTFSIHGCRYYLFTRLPGGAVGGDMLLYVLPDHSRVLDFHTLRICYYAPRLPI